MGFFEKIGFATSKKDTSESVSKESNEMLPEIEILLRNITDAKMDGKIQGVETNLTNGGRSLQATVDNGNGSLWQIDIDPSKKDEEIHVFMGANGPDQYFNIGWLDAVSRQLVSRAITKETSPINNPGE